MRISQLGCIVAAMVFVSSGFGQKAEVYGDYSYMQFNPTINGASSRALNGGGGGATFNIGKLFGVKGDFQGYGSTDVTTTISAPIATPVGTIKTGTYTTKMNMFTYMFGPEVHVQTSKMKVFGEVLFGGSQTSGYTNLYSATGLAVNPSQHPFTMAFGGGIDINAGKHVAFRLAEMDWVLTRYTNVFTSTNNQNSFRYVGGIVFKLGTQ
jgi:hypothetical protein